MIVFPNLNDYVSDYKNITNVITIRIYEYPNKIEAKYFNVCTPFPYGAFVEMLQELANQRGITDLRIEQVEYQHNVEQINIWKLAWYINNIRKNRIAKITLHRKDNPDISFRINVNNEDSIKKLIRIIKNNAY